MSGDHRMRNVIHIEMLLSHLINFLFYLEFYRLSFSEFSDLYGLKMLALAPATACLQDCKCTFSLQFGTRPRIFTSLTHVCKYAYCKAVLPTNRPLNLYNTIQSNLQRLKQCVPSYHQLCVCLCVLYTQVQVCSTVCIDFSAVIHDMIYNCSLKDLNVLLCVSCDL